MILISTEVEGGKKATAALKADSFTMAAISKEEKFEIKDNFKGLDKDEKEYFAERTIENLEWYSKNEFKKDLENYAKGLYLVMKLIGNNDIAGRR